MDMKIIFSTVDYYVISFQAAKIHIARSITVHGKMVKKQNVPNFDKRKWVFRNKIFQKKSYFVCLPWEHHGYENYFCDSWLLRYKLSGCKNSHTWRITVHEKNGKKHNVQNFETKNEISAIKIFKKKSYFVCFLQEHHGWKLFLRWLLCYKLLSYKKWYSMTHYCPWNKS